MFLPVKAILDRRTRKDGTAAIYIQYCFSSDRRVLLSTDLGVPPAHWNKRLLRVSPSLPKNFGDAEALNGRLQKMLQTVEDTISYALEQKMADPIAFLKKAWHPEFKTAELSEKAQEIEAPDAPAENLDFFVQFDAYMKAKSRKVSTGMLRTYHVVKQRLIDFQKHRRAKITFDSFDFELYESLVNYLTYDHIHHRRQTILRGLKRNSIGTTVKQLRIFLRDRARRKIIPSLDLADFKIYDEQTDAIYLTIGEIRRIYEFELTDYPELARFRDMFVLGCLTGLRFSDYNGIRPEDIRNGMLYKKQGKSDHWVVIPLRPEAHEILVKRFNKQVPKTSNGELNRHIKKVGQLAGIDTPIKVSYKKGNQDIVTTKPKHAWITTHTCRRSFCTNEFLAGTPPELIMKISGHKSLKDFYKYIRITPEEAGKMIQEIWEKRGEMRQLADRTTIQ